MEYDGDEFSFGGDVADEDLMLAYETSALTRPSPSSRAATAVTTPSTELTAPRTGTGSRGAVSTAGRPVVSASGVDTASNSMQPPRRLPMTNGHMPRGGSRSEQKNARCAASQTYVDLSAELDGLPSDAFDSSFASFSGAASHSQRSVISSARNPIRIPSQQSFRQTTLYGDTLEAEATQLSHMPNHAFVSDRPPEKPTHHKIDEEAMKTWVYPTNLGPIRDYQFSIVRSSLFNNTLVALPTGLGKTFIAATVILNFYRWTTEAKMIFVAPTKPLVSQQVEACLNVAGIPRSETTLLTGETPPPLREAEWASKRLFFMTPQTLQNDLSKGYADPKSIALLVIDEAHRATGDYAYVKVIGFLRRFTNSFRVLALTATPGSSVEAVQDVIDNLGMSNVEIRTEDSMDIRQYVHGRDIERLTMEPSSEMKYVQELFSKALKPFCDRLTQQGIWFGRDPMSLNTFSLLKAQRDWAAGPARHLNQGTKFMIMATFALLKTLAHSIKLLNFHGIRACYDSLAELRAETEKDEKGSKNRKQFFHDPDFQEMMLTIERWMREDSFESHPKLTFLKEQLHDHFKDQPLGSNTRAIVFNEFRDSAEDIVRNLNRGVPNVKASVFVGQADSKRSAGMKQKAQIEAIERFKSGEFNVLVATSIGEEGLDIGQVDLIICYDASSSPIRMLQRMGRTGRKRAGRVLLLLMKGKEEDKFAEAQDKYANMQKLISDGSRFNFRFDLSERIVPRDIKPTVDKRHVEIPIENTQNPSLPEPKKARGKLPKASKKKFHMPDGVETGFVSASSVGDGGQRKLDFAKTKTKTKTPARKKTVPEPAEIELLADVPDLETALRACRKSGGYNTSFSSAFGPADDPHIIKSGSPEFLQELRPTKYLYHGEFTRRNVRLVGRLAEGAYDRPRSLGDAYRRQKVPRLAPHSGESDAEEDEAAIPRPSRSKSLPQPRRKPAEATPSSSREPLSKRRRVVGTESRLTERARLTPAGYASQLPVKKEYDDADEDDDTDDGGSSRWSKKKNSSFKPKVKGMTRQRSSQFQSYSFGGGSVKRESSPTDDDAPAAARRAFPSKRDGEKRVPATRAPLPQYSSVCPVKPTMQRILRDLADESDDSDGEAGRPSAEALLITRASRKEKLDVLDDDLDDELDDKAAPDPDTGPEAEDAMDVDVDKDLTNGTNEMEKDKKKSRSSGAMPPYLTAPPATGFPEMSDLPGLSDMSDLLDVPDLPDFPALREPTPRQSTPPMEPSPALPRPQPPTPREPSLTPSPESDREKYIIRFSQPAGNGASLRGVRRGRGRGRGARGAAERGGARGGSTRGGARSFGAIAEEPEEAGAEEDRGDFDRGGDGRGRPRGRGRGRGRGSRGGRGGRGGAVSYGRLEERGDDCMRTSDNYETDGSDSGRDLLDFIVDDDEDVEEEPSTSSFAEPRPVPLTASDNDNDDYDEEYDGFATRRPKGGRKGGGQAAAAGGRRLVSKSKRPAVVFTSSPANSSPPPVGARTKSKPVTAAGQTTGTSSGSLAMPIRLSQTRDDSDDDEPTIFREWRGRANQQAPPAAAARRARKATAAPAKRGTRAQATGPPPKSAEFVLSGDDDSSDAAAAGQGDDDKDAFTTRPARPQRGRRLVLDSDSE